MKQIFRRPRGVSAAEIDGYQQAADQVVEAGDFIERTWEENRLDVKHPWHADDLTLLRVGYAALALSCDRTAESLREHCVVARRKTDELSPDAAAFALGLSQSAVHLMDSGVENVMTSQARTSFRDEAVIATLNPESMVPYWPRSGDGTPMQRWQRIDTPRVTTGFMRGILAAADVIRVDGGAAMLYLTDPKQTGMPVPPEYTSMAAVVGDIAQKGASRLAAAEHTLDTVEGELPAGLKSEVYGQIHRGYIDTCAAFVASVCPPMLGEEFLPNRR